MAEKGIYCIEHICTGRKYFVEPIITDRPMEFGSIDPATGKLMHKKGDGKFTGAVKPKESLITKENGFEKIHLLGKGTSPHHAIDVLDDKYPDKQ